MPRIMKQILTMIRSILSDKRLILCGLPLSTLHLIGMIILYDIVLEFDLVTHFLFGFVISEYTSRGAYSIGLHDFLTEKLRKHKEFTRSSRRIDLLIRLSGFLLIGGLMWESAEFFIGPLIGRPADPFFTLPIDLHNIDGVMDVTMGAVGSIVAWYGEAFTKTSFETKARLSLRISLLVTCIWHVKAMPFNIGYKNAVGPSIRKI